VVSRKDENNRVIVISVGLYRQRGQGQCRSRITTDWLQDYGVSFMVDLTGMLGDQESVLFVADYDGR
jgi:hypothetical protein